MGVEVFAGKRLVRSWGRPPITPGSTQLTRVSNFPDTGRDEQGHDQLQREASQLYTNREYGLASLSSETTAHASRHQPIPRFSLGLDGRHQNVILQFPLCLGIVLPRQEFHHQRVLDGKHRVVVEILALLVEDLRGDGLVAFDQDLGGC